MHLVERAVACLLLVLPLSLATSAVEEVNPSPKPYSECDEPSDEFFYLVQQWPPGYCKAERCRPGFKPPQRFTVHGFWPNYCQDVPGKDWPEYCSREKLDLEDLADLVPLLKREWPSLSEKGNDWFWEHEWDKHGTCALAYTPFGLNSQHEYFETTLKLHKENSLQEKLAVHGIIPGGGYTVSEIQTALGDSLGGDVYLHCAGANVLVEVYVCYNQQLQYVACSKQGTCDKDRLVLFAGSSLVTA